MFKTRNKLLGLLAILALVAAACSPSSGTDTTEGATATTAGGGTDTTAGGGTDTTAGDGGDAMMPGEGVSLNMGRANWASGYFQAYVYQLVLQELGYEISNPADTELDPSLAYLAMAQGDIDFWVNSWYPGHDAWHAAELPDGSLVGDHIDGLGASFAGGGIQGFLIEKGFADEFGIKTMEQFNANADAIAAYDAEDPVPGNGLADIYGCPESFTCDNIIQNQIAFGEWDNIQQVIAGYDAMFAEAEDKVGDGIPAIIYTWTPTAYVAKLIPGVNVYWLGTESVLDDSNPAEQEGGEAHQQELGPTGATSFVAIPVDQCPAAADDPDGLCPMGWLPATVTPTANLTILDDNPVFKALLENLSLPVVDISLANFQADQAGGSEADYIELATTWIADNRQIVDPAIEAALAAG
jgi:glycine betaine/proline transport system substrate-binding protein